MRAELLLRSGENYGRNTLEGRLLYIHFENEALFRYTAARWVFDRITDLITIVGFGTVEQSSIKNYEKTVSESKGKVLDLVNPFKEWQAADRRRRAREDAQREKFVEKLAEKSLRGYGSLKEIKESLGMIEKTIKESAAK